MIFFYLAKYVRKWLKKQKKSLCSIFFIKKKIVFTFNIIKLLFDNQL